MALPLRFCSAVKHYYTALLFPVVLICLRVSWKSRRGSRVEACGARAASPPGEVPPPPPPPPPFQMSGCISFAARAPLAGLSAPCL